MESWGLSYDYGEWFIEYKFKLWRFQNPIQVSEVLMELESINLESQDPNGWISQKDRKRLGLG